MFIALPYNWFNIQSSLYYRDYVDVVDNLVVIGFSLGIIFIDRVNRNGELMLLHPILLLMMKGILTVV